ncbi:hypothetical protein I5U36_01715 [Stenotrophomonas maltophilia]|nr:hypothetical protein [Stenotrophomonas maltophilia]MBH1436193.1 hypothetical protein [Stenotrophomonas maltophilia]
MSTSESPAKTIGFILKLIRKHGWVVGIGSLLLLILQFVRMNYVPQLAITDLGVVGASMLAVSVIGAVYFLVPLFLPGYAFHLLSEARVIRRPQRPELRRQYATRRITVMSECGCCGSSLPVQSLTKRRRYVWALSLLAICAGFLLAFLTHAVLLFGLSDHLVFELVYVVVALVLAAVLLASAQTLKGRRFLSHCGLSWTMILTIAAWSIYAVVIPTATLLYEFLAPPEAQIKPLGISALLLLVPIINWVIYQSGRKKTWNRVGGLTVVAISLLLGLGAFNHIADLSFAALKLGRMEGQTVILSARGCGVLREAGIIDQCRVTAYDNGLYSAGPVSVISRIGAEVLIGCRIADTPTEMRSVPIRREDFAGFRPAAWSGSSQRRSALPRVATRACSAAVATPEEASDSSQRPLTADKAQTQS